MTIISLILRNLRYYRKPYLSVLAGIVISTAVLTGALVVGDSVRYSLVQLTDIRLGKTRFSIQSGDRLFRRKLANDLALQTKSLVVPVLQLEGIAVNTDKNAQINRVEVAGVDNQFMELWNTTTQQPGDEDAILSQNTAEKLNLKPGDEFILKIRKQAKASENAPFVAETEPLVVFRLKVASIADDRQMGRFSLKSNQTAPFNIFVSLSALSRKLEMTGNANLLLITDNETNNLAVPKLDSLLHLIWQPEDVGLEFRKLPEKGNYEIRSSRIFIDDISAKAIKTSIPEVKPVFTYLINDISIRGKSTPYSFITAIDSGFYDQKLSGREINISDWLASDLSAKQGDSITLKYFKMGFLRTLTEDSARFKVKMILPITDPIFDRSLMPDFPGMSDAGNCHDWETGAPVDLDKIRDKDEKYWNNYRGTPKAFISIATGQKIWDNAFGHSTAFRFKSNDAGLQKGRRDLMNNLNPAENGLKVQDVYSEGKSAAANSTNFGELFLSLSFFIIVAALLLTALLFSLHAQKRMSETAVMATLGFRKKGIIRILFFEAAFVVVAGSLLGAFAGILYNKLLLLGLNTLWQNAVYTSMLKMHLETATLMLGFAAGGITAMLTLLIILLRNLRKPLSLIIKGIDINSMSSGRCKKKISLAVAILSFSIAVVIIIYSLISNHINDSGPFLSAGGLILVSGIALLNGILKQGRQRAKNTFFGFFTLIIRNMGIKSSRTVMAVALLAIGTFSVIITGANRKTFYGTENTRQSGTGGFLFWSESTVPVLYDLNSTEGKDKYGIADETVLQKVRFSQMLRLNGNDASCLNLNQVSQPAILGVNPDYFDLKQSFSFLDLEHRVSNQHPWLVLNKELAKGVIPGYADQTVIQWGLGKKTGDTLFYLDERGKSLKVVLLGGLDNSIFQGNILVSAGLFRQYFPSVGGSRAMLIDGAFTDRNKISDRIEYLFQDYGIMVTPASERLAQFNSVENTYLSVFMLLGGLGVILGTFGLGIVVMRNIMERQAEMALYLAVGFNRSYVLRLLATEYSFILLAGIFIGTFAAFTGLIPSIINSTAPMPWSYICAILMMILASGLLWIFLPIQKALKKNLIQSLRAE